jgi:hypothetical protein
VSCERLAVCVVKSFLTMTFETYDVLCAGLVPREWTLNGDSSPLLTLSPNTPYNFKAAADYDYVNHRFAVTNADVKGGNTDGVLHELIALSGSGSAFQYIPDQIDVGGTFSYICEYHQYMGNKIKVSAAFGITPSMWVLLALLPVAGILAME